MRSQWVSYLAAPPLGVTFTVLLLLLRFSFVIFSILIILSNDLCIYYARGFLSFFAPWVDNYKQIWKNEAIMSSNISSCFPSFPGF